MKAEENHRINPLSDYQGKRQTPTPQEAGDAEGRRYPQNAPQAPNLNESEKGGEMFHSLNFA